MCSFLSNTRSIKTFFIIPFCMKIKVSDYNSLLKIQCIDEKLINVNMCCFSYCDVRVTENVNFKFSGVVVFCYCEEQF